MKINIKAKLAIMLLLITAAGACLTALAVSTRSDEPVYSTPPAKITPPPSLVSPEQPEHGFWVAEYNGYIAVYHNANREAPAETTDIELQALRYGDQNMLREGVFFDNYLDVVYFLEDFGP